MRISWLNLLVCWAVLAFASIGCAQGNSSVSAAPAVGQRFSFTSAALQRTMPYEVLLSAGYSQSQERYPVLYLLHGWHGDETNYVTLTKLAADVARYKLIVVMPRAENSWYVNAATNPGDRFGDYIFKDLVAEVDARFRTVASPQARAIAGLSMGGYGAVLLSLQHPGAFGFVGSLSGAFDGPSGIEAVMPGLKQSTDAAFGAQGSNARTNDNIFSLVATSSRSSQPPYFLACGAGDPLLESNRRIVRLLSAHRIAYEYHELPGAHDWAFWSQELSPMLESLSRSMNVGRIADEPALSSTTNHIQ